MHKLLTWTMFCILCATLHLPAQEKGLVFAHRGGAHEFEENTLHAFKSSYAAGLRGFETDIRITQDGVLVILHDDNIKRTYNGDGFVEEMTADAVRAITSKKGGFPFLFLDELLEFFADKPGIYLELEMKTSNKKLYPDAAIEAYCQKLYAAAMARKPADSFYVFTSFDERPLRAIKKIDPEADILFITNSACTPEVVAKAQALGAKRIGCRVNMTSRDQVRNAQKDGIKITVWPGHSVADYELGVALGADLLCSDVPVKVATWKAAKQKCDPKLDKLR